MVGVLFVLLFKRLFVFVRVGLCLFLFLLVPGIGYDLCITKTYLYNFDSLKLYFYIVKLGFTGLFIIFPISAQNIDCRYSLESPRRGSSNEYPS